MRLEFRNLPLVEAAVRCTFKDAVPLNFTVIGRVHDAVKDEFPVVGEPTNYEQAPGLKEEQIQIGPGKIQAVVLQGHANGLRITLQQHVCVCRWIMSPFGVTPRYPRFESLRDELWNAVAVLGRAADIEQIAIAVVNMSYVNFIERLGSGTAPGDYLSEPARLRLMKDATAVRQIENSWLGEDEIDVRFRLANATKKVGDEEKEGYELTTAAGARLANGDDPKQQLDRIHARLQAFFVELISTEAKKEWGLQVDAARD